MKTSPLILLLITCGFILGCKPEKSTVTEKTIVVQESTPTTWTTTNTSTSTSNSSTIPYYKINDPPIVVHGSPTGVVVWSSETNLPAEFSQNIFLTNSTFNVRIVPRKTHYGTDTSGQACNYQPLPYDNLKVGVRLRSQASSYGAYHEFTSAVDQESNVYEFPVPQNTSDPLVLEILNVKWDYTCKFYEAQGHSATDPLVSAYCPFDKVWDPDCVQIEVHFSTDDTQDLVGTRD